MTRQSAFKVINSAVLFYHNHLAYLLTMYNYRRYIRSVKYLGKKTIKVSSEFRTHLLTYVSP